MQNKEDESVNRSSFYFHFIFSNHFILFIIQYIKEAILLYMQYYIYNPSVVKTMFQFTPLQSRDYLNKISIKVTVTTEEGNNQNEILHSANYKIGVAVQYWL